MDISQLKFNLLTQTAIVSLKAAYDQCGDKAAKDSIITAFKAVVQLHQDLGRHCCHDGKSENDSDYDPGEYCAAV